MKFVYNTCALQGTVSLPGSKSESNRALIMRSLSSQFFEIANLSNAADTVTLNACLANKSDIYNVGPAGTAMRFLCAKLAITAGDTCELTGSERMQQRPIGVLVNALRSLGADISYVKNDGYPPLAITGKTLEGGNVKIDGSISSQFLTALALIAPSLEKGIHFEFTTPIASRSYFLMSLSMMAHFGIKHTWITENELSIPNQEYTAKPVVIESDWSSASYWFSLVALSENGKIRLRFLKESSLQGDSILTKLYTDFGVKTTFLAANEIELNKIEGFKPSNNLAYNCEDFPDIAQTLAVTAAGLGINLNLSGLQSLRIKETDRIAALQSELAKFEIQANAQGDDVLIVEAGEIQQQKAIVNTFDDHRMAMAFAPLALVLGKIEIEDPNVVVKSYPEFWQHLAEFAGIHSL